MENTIEVVKKGIWKYNNEIEKDVMIIKQNWDFYYEEDFEDESPDLNVNGEAFYVLYDEYSDIRYAIRSQTCLTLDEAINLAETKVGKIKWI